MNRWMLYKTSRQKYRKYAFCISLVVHLIFVVVMVLLLINSEIQDLEDGVQVKLMPGQLQQPIVQKRPKLIVKKETPSVMIPESQIEITKMPTGSTTAVEIHPTSLRQVNIDDSTVADASNLSTDADLPMTPKSILSPIGKGIRRGASKTIGDLTDAIIASSGGLPIDVVFIVDASESMKDNINAVAAHLGQMIDAYKASEIDYQLGLTYFNATSSQSTQQNNIKVFQLTRDLAAYKQRLYAITAIGNENALDAIHHTLKQLKFRTNAIKHLIVVTDEPFTTLEGHSVEYTVQVCQRNKLIVHVLGKKFSGHRRLAAATGGSWHAVPQD